MIRVYADPDSHEQFAACRDVQIAAPDRLNVGDWSTGDESARVFSKYIERKQPMPVAVIIGGDPSVLLATMAPVVGADPLSLAGALRTKPIDVVTCRSVDLLVPAESDFRNRRDIST